MFPFSECRDVIVRRKTRQVVLGDREHGFVRIGGDAPVSVQSMTAGYTHEIDKCVAEIQKRLPEGYGIEIARDQSEFIGNAIGAVKEHLVLGSLLARFREIVDQQLVDTVGDEQALESERAALATALGGGGPRA